MRFEFATATRIIFGPGTIDEVSPEAAKMGKRAFVITGRSPERAKGLFEQLKRHAIEYVTFSVPTEPTTTIVAEAVNQARQTKSDLVIGIGGGSTIDTGKVIAAMLTNSGKLLDYLEVVGLGKPLKKIPAPYIAIPTTAGTGAEVTRNAVLAVCEKQVKVSMRSPLMLPRLAVVDPVLTHSMPPSTTASTGLDALTQLIEAYVSNKANPMTDGICREGLKRAGRSLRQAYENGSDCDAREDMALASLFSGLALANAKLGAVHGFAGPLGGMIFAPHGVICATLLPFVCQANVKALQSREPDSPALARYDQVARILTGESAARAADGVEWVQELCVTLTIPTLTEFGLKEQDFPTVVVKAQKSSSMKGNPIPLTDDELMKIMEKSQ
ncbi:MAG: iron-containing alcohol dehydrogenase [Planctomycetota bacterium]|jgi:alcohol dehydrogenase class IV